MKGFSRLFGVAAILACWALAPTAASADDGATLAAAAEGSLGTVVSNQVTAPITIGDITYVPGPATGGTSGVILGTVLTPAVVAPITVGDITYLPE